MSAPGAGQGLDALELRALRRLGAPGMVAVPGSFDPDTWGVHAGGDRRHRRLAQLARASVERLLSTGALARTADREGVVLTPAGEALVRRAAAGREDAFRAQHQALAPAPETMPDPEQPDAPADGGTGRRRVVDLAESPLSWLARRCDADGVPFISARELVAGDRLRSDYIRGRFIGRLTSDWSAPPPGSAARGPVDGLAPTEAALAARDRVRAALRRLGPGLDRVASAVCLEGRGLADVERGWGWPQRTGKIVLRLALSRLADHYGLPPDKNGERAPRGAGPAWWRE